MTGPATTNGTNGKSWYLDAFKQLGFPVVIVAFLLAQDAGYVPSSSRDALAVAKSILADTNQALETQKRWHEDVVKRHERLLEELRALRRRQAALCLVMLQTFAGAGKDIIAIRESCVAEAMSGTP